MMGKLPIVSEDDDTDIIGFQVQGHTSNSGSELNHLTCLNFIQSNDSGNTVTNANDCSEFFYIILNLDPSLRFG